MPKGREWKGMKIALTLPFLFVLANGIVFAQEEITIFSDNTPLVLPATSPAIVEQKVGSVLTGTVHGATSLECTLQNCMTSQNFNGEEFEGQMPPYEAKIQTPSETVVFEPLADTGLPFGLTDLDLVLIAVVVVAIAIVAIVIRDRVNH